MTNNNIKILVPLVSRNSLSKNYNIFPLSLGMSNSETIKCNENGYY